MTAWLIDKSALARLGVSRDPTAWADRIERGLVRICSVTRLELGYSARSADELQETLSTPPVSALLIEHSTPAIEERAVQVQRLLAERGMHRAPSIADILLAATAEAHGLVVLHVDKDFELIARVTGQAVERLETVERPETVDGVGAGD
ncbi:PIN domain nuclease [Herbiconiux sp. P15]|uniref:PIN domain nuclease n=1 Tax=Herbiconiux liukaitaii TaxID=3342799 RepID=UPI0035BAE7C8